MPAPNLKRPREGCGKVSIWILLLSNLLVFQLTYNYVQQNGNDSTMMSSSLLTVSTTSTTATTTSDPSSLFSLDFHKEPAVALPSIRLSQEEQEKLDRDMYGGAGDKAHLGGWTTYDGMGVSPSTWKYMISQLNIKSVLDVGCGRGISTLWFHLHKVKSLCVEGSHDAVLNSIFLSATATNNDNDPGSSSSMVVEHDFSRGPWWPPTTVDAVWCVEFLEHVGRQYHYNYIQAFRKAALIFASHSGWGGWHHVEVRTDDWWIRKFQMYGFIYSEELTKMIHDVARAERGQGQGPDGKDWNAQHVWLNMQVFINPVVAALPQHAHLASFGHGCYDARRAKPGNIVNRECGSGGKNADKETKVPPEYYPIELTPEMDSQWEQLIQKNIKAPPKQ